MLITNFSAGELSNALFGRTDIPQYYSGVSTLENFDVIPTGGIERRPGTKRILESLKDENGNLILNENGNSVIPKRIVPFILNREEAYLVIFTHEKIIIYLVGDWDKAKKVFTNADIKPANAENITDSDNTIDDDIENSETEDTDDPKTEEIADPKTEDVEEQTGNDSTPTENTNNPESEKIEDTDDPKNEEIEYTTPETLYTDVEIPLVQHAQNFRTMVLVHKNHPPIKIVFYPENIIISILSIIFPIQFIHSPDLIPKFVSENDKNYENNGYLIRPGQYPGCVTFFNERLVFASTNENGQRLFFSRVNDYEDFSTYKSYITEKRNYITIIGSVENGKNTIEIDNNELGRKEAEKITETPRNYIIDSPFFPAGTRILTANRKNNEKIIIRVSKPAENIISDLSIEELKEKLKQSVNNFRKRNNNKKKYKRIADINVKANIIFFKTLPIDISIGASEYTLSTTGTSKTYLIDNEAARLIDNNYQQGKSYLARHIRDNAKTFAKSFSNSGYKYDSYTESNRTNSIEAVVEAWIKDSVDGIMIHLKFADSSLPGSPYYGFMPNIEADILNAAEYGTVHSQVYIPLYTSDQIKDDYPAADDGFTLEIASDRNDDIRWLVQNKNLIVGTARAEYVMPSNINAVNISAFLNSFYGTSKLQASSAGDAILFFRDGQKGLVEYYIPEADNYFRTNDLTMLAPHMLRESEAVDFDIIAIPYTKLIVTRKDGQIVTLLYDRTSGIFAWNRIITGKGSARSLAVIPGKNGYDDIYLLIEIDGKHYIELLEFEGCVYLDSYKLWNGDRSGYTDDAVVFSKNENKIFALSDRGLSKITGEAWIGYRYTSRVVSMPILANNSMKPNNIKNLLIRFLDSRMPVLKAHPGGLEDEIPADEPFSGVKSISFPGTWDRDAMFELYYNGPGMCKILAINTEVN